MSQLVHYEEIKPYYLHATTPESLVHSLIQRSPHKTCSIGFNILFNELAKRQSHSVFRD